MVSFSGESTYRAMEGREYHSAAVLQTRPGQTGHGVSVSRPNTAARSTSRRDERRLVILGASARALAESAARAGWDVHAADLFCDLDLQAVARDAVPVTPVDGDAGYPWSLFAAADAFPPSAAWCYTGAIENHPDLIEAISRARPLAGNTAAAVRRLRDPAELAAATRAAGLSFPETLVSADGVPLDGTFLVKPLASAGGRGIRRWTPEVAADWPTGPASRLCQPRVWQRFVAGDPLSASYCMAEGAARLVGLSRQLIGEPWCQAAGFAWCGAVALHSAESPGAFDRLIASLERLGGVLAERFQTVGLVGVDLIADMHGHITVIEVNPRPTASMELFERSGSGSIAGSHLAACGFAPPSDTTRQPPVARPALTWAKAVLFAAHATPVSQPLIDAMARETKPWTQADGGWPALADIPRPGQTIAAGAPVVTIFAVGRTADDALAILRDRVARIDALLAARV